MTIVERIQDNFINGYFGRAMEIFELPNEYPAWTFKQDNLVGVVVPIKDYFPFSEKFANTQIATAQSVYINNVCYDVLMLTCSSIDLRDEFATICAQFVDPGINGSSRTQLIAEPEIWWKNWRALLGNSISNKESYPVLGELLLYEYFIEKGVNVQWTGIDNATHDFELDDCSVEVKSTTERYGYEVTISSLYQMIPAGKPLYLVFFRFERSLHGRNIDDVIEKLSNHGISLELLEKALSKHGLEKGCTARRVRYKVLESRRYCVDDEFPSVTEKSFKEEKLPQSVIKFTYTIDLSGIPSVQLD